MNQDWDIKPCSESCKACGRTFDDGQAYLSRLVDEQDEYKRQDYCELCWNSIETGADGFHSSWRGIYYVPLVAEEVLKKETAESLLRKLMETGDKSKRNLIYVLAVMLERKRVLVERGSQRTEAGSKQLVYEYRKTGEMFIIPDPELLLDQLEDVQSEVAALLGGGKKEKRLEGSAPEEDAIE